MDRFRLDIVYALRGWRRHPGPTAAAILALTLGIGANSTAGLEADARVRCQLDESVSARGDAMRVRQIIVNLLTNADRHTPVGGRITVSVRRNVERAVIDVHNAGSSLSREEAGRVFDRFYRADPSRQRATGGSGLGLAIVKHLSEVQNGSACASSDDSGVTFSVSLPLA